MRWATTWLAFTTGVDASLPYFLPAPTLIGTMGAFIRIRSPIYTKAALFDIGIAGPLAGFLFLLPALAIGVAMVQGDSGHSRRKVTSASARRCSNAGCASLIFPGTPVADIYLHPMARAAWVGVLATALNLLPIGQLDGGHIALRLCRRKHKRLLADLLGSPAGVGASSCGALPTT